MTTVVGCSVDVTLSPESSPLCSTGWISIPYETLAPFDVSTLVVSDLISAFTLGIFISVPPIMAAFGLAQMIKLVKGN